MRKTYDKAFKAKVAIEAIQEVNTIQEIAQKYEVHPNQVSLWKKQILDGAGELFERKGKKGRNVGPDRNDQLMRIIGELQVERDFLKKKYRQIYGREPNL
jgi:transposase